MGFPVFAVQLFCAIFSCAPRQHTPVPQVNSLTSEFDHYLEKSGPPVIQTLCGWVQGTHMKTIKGREIASFMGIPYAKPPIGDLRFRSPRPVEPWDGFFHADKPGSVCLQVDASQFYLVMGQEDCLNLNVYTPKSGEPTPEDKLLPVIFFIHGGGYFFGSSDAWGPAYLLDRDIILVTVNFRQGVLGFFSTGDSAAPGNFGLKDQALALRWVVENIVRFGGDPTRITVMGVGSGASIANLNLISKQTKDFVANAIFHSGSAHQHWSLVNTTIKNSWKVADFFNCPLEDSHAMVDCLRGKNPHFVANALQRVYKIYNFPWVNFGPVVEAPGPEAFLEETPFDAYASNNVKKVPVLGGITENEGDFFIHTLLKIIWKPNILKSLNKDWYDIAPHLFDYSHTAFNPNEVSRKIQEYYLFDEPILYDTRDRISRAVGDRFIVQGTYKGLQIHSRIAPTYGYVFDFRGNPSITRSHNFRRKDWGVTHTDDLLYLFNSSLLYDPLKISEPEFRISEFMTAAWVNFAHSGKPTLDASYDTTIWNPISDPLNMEVLEINYQRQMIPFPYKDRMDFWSSLQLQYDYNLLPVIKAPLIGPSPQPLSLPLVIDG